MTPDWLFQVMWFGAGVGGTGAVWYFLSQRSYHAALWTGFTTVVVVLLAITLHIRNDLLRGEQQGAAATPRPAPGRLALANLSGAVTPSVPDRPGKSKANLQEKSPTEKEAPIATYPPMSTAQDVEHRQVMRDLTSDKASPAPEQSTIREKSAAEILAHLKGITPSYRFREKVEELYRGRWTREPGWQATVHPLPSKLPGGSWFCSLKEVGSGTPVMAVTVQDVSTLRTGDSVTVSGRIRDVSILEDVSLEDTILRGDNVPSPWTRALQR
jgi:hypothetical protein